MNDASADSRLKTSRAVVVEGRDDVDAAGRAIDALIIPTHGFGITAETWAVIEKAAAEKGLIILTDPDHAGSNIRKRLTEKFPDSIQAYIAREDAECMGDIGVENAEPEVIKRAVKKALERAEATSEPDQESRIWADMRELTALGLAGSEGASERRARVCRALGIGCGNAGAMIKRLRGFGIDRDELRKTVKEIE